MTLEIIDSPAQQLEARIEENFDEFASRIFERSNRPIRHKDGTSIELRPDLRYSFLLLGLQDRVATEEEFTNLTAAIMLTIKQFEAQGLLPVDWVQQIRTPLDIIVPEVPQRFIDELEEGVTVRRMLVGNTTFAIEKHFPAPIIDEEETDEEETPEE